MRLKKRDYNLHYPLLKTTLGVIIPNVSTTIEIRNQEKPPGDHHSEKILQESTIEKGMT